MAFINCRNSILPPLLSILILFLIAGPRELFVSARTQSQLSTAPKRLFVFGDSYADTGNLDIIPEAYSWYEPYGMTYPGEPSGRASDGRVLTDYIAQSLGLNTPVTYREWASNSDVDTKHGMNFAFGGSGVFETVFETPNMETQIDYFEKLIEIHVYKVKEFTTSMAFVSLSGNDYLSYLMKNESLAGLLPFIGSVVNQLSTNIRRIHSLGIHKIAVTSLMPLGCLPYFTANNGYRFCNQIINGFVLYHNNLLKNFIRQYNEETQRSDVVYLDLHSAFTQISGSGQFENLYQQCCKGLTNEDSCGKVDENGEKRYTICSDTSSAFFWDKVHPTQAGWNAVSSLLQETVKQISPLDHFIRMLPSDM